MGPVAVPCFLCDSMLGGLSRWLRTAGYDAEFAGPIDDGVLVARAATSGAILLTSDAPLMDRRPIRTGEVKALFVPRAEPLLDQAAFVLRSLSLSMRTPRCLACGGSVGAITREAAAPHVPPVSREVFEEFWRCERCERVYWKGAHWEGIDARRCAIARAIEER